MPVPVTIKQIQPAAVSSMAQIALAVPYDGPEPEYEGLNNLQVLMIRTAAQAAGGDLDAIHCILDRAVGKPKTISENLNVSMSYQDLLKQWAEEEINITPDANDAASGAPTRRDTQFNQAQYDELDGLIR